MIRAVNTSLIDISDSLQCTSCGNYLSRKPIYGSLCGRCDVPNEPQHFRNFTFENLARGLAFPCMNDEHGCSYIRPFDELAEHEDVRCSYRKYVCPNNCNWSGIAVELIMHYRKEHKELSISKNFLLSIDDSCMGSTTWLLEEKRFSFLVVCNQDDSHTTLNVYYFTSAFEFFSNVSYNLSVVDENQTCVKYRNKEALHLSYAGDFSGHLNRSVSLDDLRKHGVSELRMSIEINLPEDIKPLDTHLLRCRICRMLSSPPIYSCRRNHTVCLECYSKQVNWCPICKKNTFLNRNSVLENISGFYLYNCKWENCYEVFTCKEIREHQEKCTSHRRVQSS